MRRGVNLFSSIIFTLAPFFISNSIKSNLSFKQARCNKVKPYSLEFMLKFEYHLLFLSMILFISENGLPRCIK
jgi:hypothetical protein